MAAWEMVYLPRRLSPTPALEHVIQVDRVGKGALSYLLVSDGDAVIVDPGRHLQPYEVLLEELGATAAAGVDTHRPRAYLSGALAAAARWHVPYFVHPDDARSPYDGTEGRFAQDRKSTRLNSSHGYISYAVFCLKKKNNKGPRTAMTALRLASLENAAAA